MLQLQQLSLNASVDFDLHDCDAILWLNIDCNTIRKTIAAVKPEDFTAAILINNRLF